MRTELYSTQRLRADGFRTRDIRAAVAAGTLRRLRRGWYGTAATAPEVAAACRVGGSVTCLSALRLHGAWTVEPLGVHVRIADGVSRVDVPGATFHRTAERVTPGVDSIEDALRQAVACVDLRALVVAVDSLAHRGLLPAEVIRQVLGASARGRRTLALHDPAAESGIESLVRLALRSRRIRVRSQVIIPGVGRVDLLIGERLIVEADGYEWHGGRGAFERDRQRDRELVRLGFIVVRPSYAAVMNDLDAVVAAIVDVIARRDHHWRAVHRSQLSRSGYLIDVSSTSPRRTES